MAAFERFTEDWGVSKLQYELNTVAADNYFIIPLSELRLPKQLLCFVYVSS